MSMNAQMKRVKMLKATIPLYFALSLCSISSSSSHDCKLASSIHSIMLTFTKKQKWPLMSNPPSQLPPFRLHCSADLVPLRSEHDPPVTINKLSISKKIKVSKMFLRIIFIKYCLINLAVGLRATLLASLDKSSGK